MPGIGRLGVTETALAIAPVPSAFFAATLNQYVDPFVNPVAVHVRAVELAAPSHPAAAANVPEALVATCTLYPVTTDPPLLDGAAHDRAAKAFPDVALTLVGVPGADRASGVAENV